MINYSVTTISDTPIFINETYKKNSVVFVENKPIMLGNLLGTGGEADVFYIKDNYEDVIKIYKEKKLTQRKEAKLKKLLSIKISDRRICAPKKIVTNSKGKFIGYVMKKSGPSKGRMTLKQRLLGANDTGLTGWSRKNLVEMVNTILSLLLKLYSIPCHRILVGDINLDNFVVFSPKEIFLVDVDSIQVDEFPCPVGQDNFVPSELQGVQFANTLRTPEQERFSVACLLFLCLMNNKNPYACVDGETPAANIKAGRFPYLEDGGTKENVPIGNWKYLWSFLPDYIRDAFVRTFSATLPSDRIKITEWRYLIDKYLSEFDSLVSKDSMVNEIIQTRYPNWIKTVSCRGCGQRVPKNQISPSAHVCYACEKKGVKLIQCSCKECGKIFYSEHFSTYCKTCYEKLKKEQERIEQYRNQHNTGSQHYEVKSKWSWSSWSSFFKILAIIGGAIVACFVGYFIHKYWEDILTVLFNLLLLGLFGVLICVVTDLIDKFDL